MAEGRLFFALWPDTEVRQRLARLAREQKPQGGRLHHPEDLHITLVFLGQVADERMPCVYEAAQQIAGSPFTLQIDTIGHWPRPRILWCGPSTIPDLLLELVKGLQLGLTTCGFTPEKRRYKPHVTLHRKVRDAQGGSISEPFEWRAADFVLATSGGNTPGKPRYHILHRWPLN
ncbi:MAG: RNA 2',3'-cyclic phosphodiesterase [Gammaproteobacteria bacterium]|nr:RNA 2',3'-cyclic phosphodiesterase [Gammaproteobacteria bacterium]